MTKRDDGGPAFPQNDLSGYGMGPSESNNGGMTLRDWFAGQVISQIVCMYAADNKAGIGVEHLPRNCAAHAYTLADAMLKARAS